MSRSQRLITREYTFKICVLGIFGTGKTSLVNVFKTGQQIGNNSSTIGVDIQFKDIEIDGNIVRLTIWDTGGQEQFQSIGKNYVRNAHGILLVYSYDKTASVIQAGLQSWMDFAKDYALPGAPVVLVGNKVDLPTDQREDFTTRMGETMSRNWNSIFFETSAKDHYNVDATFKTLVAEIIQRVKGKILEYREPNIRIERVRRVPDTDDSCC